MAMYGFGDMYAEMSTFFAIYKCYSVSLLGDREDVEKGGKILMPPSALYQLSRMNIQYPMLFRLTNKKAKRETHCGVLEFVADEGKIFIPSWMMRNLQLEEGKYVSVENVALSLAEYAKFQPQTPDFLDITNPKAVLEHALRNFACLTEGDMVAIKYNDTVYELCVLNTKPRKAVSIIECDLNVDFAPPVGYQEPQRQPKADDGKTVTDGQPMETVEDEDPTFRPFMGQGNRLNGKKGTDSAPQPQPSGQPRRGIPNYDHKPWTITFFRNFRPATNSAPENNDDKKFEAFSGQGQSLRTKNKK